MVNFIIFGFTLPLRSICWTLWYKKLGGTKSGTKKVSKKGKKQLDPEILRRANLKDDGPRKSRDIENERDF